MKSLHELNEAIVRIEARNKRVELDKAWETSLHRKLFISGSTYVLMVICMFVLDVDKPFVSAIIPAVAYLISTVSLGMLKEVWLKKQRVT